MTILFIRLLFILVGAILGYHTAYTLISADMAVMGLGLGLLTAVVIIVIERFSKNVSLRGLSSAVFGLILGLLLALLLRNLLAAVPTLSDEVKNTTGLIMTAILCYFGVILAMRGRDEFNIIIPYVRLSRQDQQETIMILDTSVIIDGRIADIAQTRFLEGRFIVPHFILKELQQIADSSDPLKRARGRRGLDILDRLKKISGVQIKIHQQDFPEVKEVDAKLIKLAKALEAKIITNDYNLNKVAGIQGVGVLNINELANSLKPVFLPGEELNVKIVKEGSEQNQGIAYLDDGTMIVVDNARHLINKRISVTVTSALQTTAGKMIFAKRSGDLGRKS
jgi:uncharacterized protein YacL